MSAPETERLLTGRYRLRAVIGRGGMGAVWRARDELLNRDVAVKEIIWPPEMDEADQETVRRRAVREAQMLARLRHPNVVGVYDFFEEAGRPVIVMELVPFHSLRDTVRDAGPLPPARVARIGLGTLAGLQAAHQAGIVHRDVKPANILLGPEDRIVLTDFGIAKAFDSPTLTTSGILIGSPSYLAPERALGEPGEAAADLWGLGASLYFAVEGKPPFERPGVLASLTAVVSEEPEPPLHAGQLEPVIGGLLRKNPGARLGAADAERMLHDVLEQDTAVRTASMPGPTLALGPAADTGPAPAQAPAPSAPEADTESLPPVAAAHAPAAVVPPEPAAAAVPDATGPADEPAAPVPHGPPPVRRRGPRRARGLWVALIAVVGIAAITAAVTRGAFGTSGHPAALPSPKAPARSSVPAPARAPVPASAASTAPAATSAPASTPAVSGGAASAVPGGYYRFTNSTGFSIGVPVGWQIQHVGHYVYIRDPANGGIFLLIDQSDQPKPDPLADWQEQAAARQGSYPGYRLIRLATVSYPQAEKAADWQFTYDRDGVEVEVLDRNVLANAQHAYALYWSTPVSDWNAYYHYFQAFATTFHPAS
jgi:tRNA A-37 threonylcarbamoyl transferase component Bud32